VAHSGFGKSQSHKKIDNNIQAVEAQINDIIKAKVLEQLDPKLYEEGTTDFEELMANTKFVNIQLDGAVIILKREGCVVS
jgi:RNA-binding protein YhbY